MHESAMHPVSSFVTLTYDRTGPSLNYRDFQLFMKRLRKARGATRFYMCGEYGELEQRPHFHAALFGQWFSNDGNVSDQVWRSNDLEKLWPHGFSTTGALTPESARYIAGYVTKKITGPAASGHYNGRTPEFSRMSLRPGIGRPWFDRYYKDVYAARDGAIINGKIFAAPRYYDQLLQLINPALSMEKEADRFAKAEQYASDCTPERLQAREIVALAKDKSQQRNKLA